MEAAGTETEITPEQAAAQLTRDRENEVARQLATVELGMEKRATEMHDAIGTGDLARAKALEAQQRADLIRATSLREAFSR